MLYDVEKRPGRLIDLDNGTERLLRGQIAQAARLLLAHGPDGLTPIEALREGGIYNWAGRINDLRNKYGVRIDGRRHSGSRMVTHFLQGNYRMYEVL